MKLPFLFVALLALSPLASAQVWDRPVTPGIVFRMERQVNPTRSVYGLRIDPRRVRAETALAKKTVYDLSPYNGRDVLSAMVKDHDALGGINGDFFQWGKDPGGDPMNLMVRGGELLSHPVGGNRGFAAGWGPDSDLALGAANWEARFAANGGPDQRIHSLNARADGGQVTLHTDSAAYAYASAEAIAARVWMGAYRLGPNGTLSGIVVQVAPLQGRVRIAPGEFLLTGAGRAADAVRALKPGDRIQVRVRVTGFDWSRVGQVMGGGPILLRDGKSALAEGANDFNDTRHPRTAMGRTADGDLWFVVIDGRQAISAGASLAETAEILLRWGCTDAINLDGGGSSTMNLFGITLNRPSAGAERAVANGVLFYGERPASSERRVEIKPLASPLVVGQPVRIEILLNGVAAPAARTLFAAQGAGWIDQEGTLHPVHEGPVAVAAMVDGTVVQARLEAVNPKATSTRLR